ncbi:MULTISPECIES: phosphoglucosamine mutase [Methanosarcina]|uniref:Phosphomannomutase n=3 Tax=Methanosarcina barkeri TaxID=2208 RepID=A0A0E3QWT8_METBA|nr:MULTISPECIES: phosphoglucosamine mutase [Methanosarcina]AKB55205.1 Phosphomannomutase [Methanosarcina barkeri MS]AKB56721.1 Phosphomannomutase [Methanosarcina barkeri 227]AKJ37301.1 phosphoglucosamine mutase GlmM1 [Methanosarcina barkeri CM1]OED01061.1 phosphoglucosamine mutase [Methanosarcina sp. A14]
MVLFGTNGVRGIANEYITPELAVNLARCLGTYMKSKGTVAIGCDTRISGQMLKSAAIAGALSTGLSVIDVGIVPTPAILYYVRDFADAGIIVTASHNPRQYNGIKFIAGDGSEFSRDAEKDIEKIYRSGKYSIVSWEKTGSFRIDPGVNEYYVRNIIKSVNAEAIRSHKFKVVTDTGCGAGSLTLPFLLKELGCQVLTLEAQLDGTFPWRNPEPLPEALTELTNLVKMTGSDLGVAQDGDADRVVFVDENGQFVNDDVLLAMIAKYMVKHEKGPLVTPVSSSQRMVDVAEEEGVELYWTAVGSINVVRKMMEVNAVFGGEGNGGLIFPKHQYCRDGAMGCAKVLEILASGKKLSDLEKSVPHYFNEKTKVPAKNEHAIMEIVKNKASGLGHKIDTSDGVKIWYKDGWVLMRPSGTEPIFRIFAEAKNQKRAEELMQEGLDMIIRAEKRSRLANKLSPS